jgi:tellurite resistance protein TerC
VPDDPVAAPLAPALTLAASESTTRIPGADLHVPAWLWIFFGVVVVASLLLDLLVINKEAHVITMREATISSIGWILLGLVFGLFVWFELGGSAAGQYYTGYIIEKSLSVDNVFVWAVLFSYFSVPPKYQHRTLFWGVFGALVMRAAFVLVGIRALERFEWLIYVFGAFLVFTGVRIGRHEPGDVHPERNPVLKVMRRFVPMTADYHGQRFFVREAGRWLATPLLVVLVMVEATDLVFAIDSIPAILAVSRSTFIVYASNAFAILGLRALYFLLAGAAEKLVHLNKGLAVILVYVGIKMLLSDVYHIPTFASLGFISVVLTITVIWSLRSTPQAPLLPGARAAGVPSSTAVGGAERGAPAAPRASGVEPEEAR